MVDHVRASAPIEHVVAEAGRAGDHPEVVVAAAALDGVVAAAALEAVVRAVAHDAVVEVVELDANSRGTGERDVVDSARSEVPGRRRLERVDAA
jgi:hypothetical protein